MPGWMLISSVPSLAALTRSQCRHLSQMSRNISSESQRKLFVSPPVDLAWCSGSVIDCHATAWGSIPGGNGVKT